MLDCRHTFSVECDASEKYFERDRMTFLSIGSQCEFHMCSFRLVRQFEWQLWTVRTVWERETVFSCYIRQINQIINHRALFLNFHGFFLISSYFHLLSLSSLGTFQSRKICLTCQERKNSRLLMYSCESSCFRIWNKGLKLAQERFKQRIKTQ